MQLPSRSTLIFVAAAAAVALVAGVLRWTAPAPREAAPVDPTAEIAEQPAVSVDALRVDLRPRRHMVEISATFEARREVVIGAEVSGPVVELSVEENQPVAAGDPLVRLDAALAEVAVERAEANLASAKAVADLGRALHLRQRELKQQGVGSQTDFDQTLSEAARSAAALLEARAALHEAQTLLDKTVIRAPFAGVVTRFELEPGSYVRMGDPVAEMADLSAIEVVVGVDDRQIIAVEADRPVEVTADALPGEWFEGRIASLGRTPDARTQKYRVPVRVPNPDMRLLPGMIGRVRLQLGDETLAIRVPRRVVRSEYELDFVWVLDLDAEVAAAGQGGIVVAGGGAGAGAEATVAVEAIGRARLATVQRRRVKTTPIPFRPDLVDVDAGLEPGEIVAASNLRELADGLRVQVASIAGTDDAGDEVALP